MARLLLVVALALGLVALPVGEAGAVAVWCEDDPPVLITTPGGASVVVYVTNGVLGVEHLPAAQVAKIDHTVKSVQGGQATKVDMTVLIPGDAFDDTFPTRSTVSRGSLKTGVIYAQTEGVSGELMRLSFTLEVP